MKRNLIELKQSEKLIKSEAQMKKKSKLIKAGLVGYPLGYSISPTIHEFLFEQAGRDGEYRTIKIQPDNFIERIPNILREYPYLNVTIPYKKEIVAHLQGTSDSARILGVVNTVVNELGYNTDGIGMKLALDEWDKPEHALVIGSGNTSRTALYTLIEMDVPNIYMIHRNALSLQKLKNDLIQSINIEIESTGSFKFPDSNQKIRFFVDQEDIFESEAQFDLLINTTSGGMYPEIDQLPIKPEILNYLLSESKSKVFDVIYNPLRTKLLSLAEQNNLEYQNGLAMLFYQAYASHTIWFSEDYSTTKAKQLWTDFQNKFDPEKLIAELQLQEKND